MKATPSRVFYISLDTEEMITALESNMIHSHESGVWRVDIQPVFREIGLSPEKPYFGSPKWHQRGNFYPPDVGYISEIPVEYFFNEKELFDQGAIFEPSEIESDEEIKSAISYFREVARNCRLQEVIDEPTIYGKPFKYVYKIQWRG